MEFQKSSYALSEEELSVEVCLVIRAGSVDSEKRPGVDLDASIIANTSLPGINT